MKKLEKLDNDLKPTGEVHEYPLAQAERMLSHKNSHWREVKSEKKESTKPKTKKE